MNVEYETKLRLGSTWKGKVCMHNRIQVGLDLGCCIQNDVLFASLGRVRNEFIARLDIGKVGS